MSEYTNQGQKEGVCNLSIDKLPIEEYIGK